VAPTVTATPTTTAEPTVTTVPSATSAPGVGGGDGSPDGELPVTGGDAVTVFLTGTVLLLVGLGAIGWSRWRQRRGGTTFTA
jgi:LPXTG-motif cell wall-anchored protein